MATASTKNPELRRGLIFVALAALAVGLGVAIYLVRHKLGMMLDPTYESGCNISSKINCDAVNTSDWSMLFGLPVSLYAVPTYLLMGWFLKEGLFGWNSKVESERESAKLSVAAAGLIGLLTVGASLYLAYISAFVIKVACQYCMTMYAANIIATGAIFYAAKMSPADAWRRTFHGLAELARPIIPAAGLLVVTFGISWAAYDMTFERMEADSMSVTQDAYEQQSIDLANAAAVPIDDPDLAPEDGPLTVVAAPGRPVPAPVAAAPTAPSPTAAAGGGVVPAVVAAPVAPVPAAAPVPAGIRPQLMDPRSSVRKGEKTENGFTYFEAPLAANEFYYGKADSPVTIVKFADFQCAYCRVLANNMKKVKTKYKDKVRFVMKHFPMNPKCNRYMAGYDKHPVACETSFAAYCGGLQEKFWEMHDKLYEKQTSLAADTIRPLAEEIGLDMAQFDACMIDPATEQAIKNDIKIGIAAGINGTPKTYIGNRLVTGSATGSVLEYYIDKALEDAAGGAAAGAAAPAAPKPDGSSMIQGKTATGTFWIDPYEAALHSDGKAISIPDVQPAEVSWFDAKAACESAGKRLCTEEEWVSACTGVPAVDNNSNGWFSDDTVEGGMYPYGAFHQAGNCQDSADKYEGRPLKTGTKPKCRGPSGIHDQVGNIGEWVNDEKKATLMGGYASSGQGAACNQRSYGSGAGRRNHTTGFRCCSDTNVTGKPATPADVKVPKKSLLNGPVPVFTAEDSEGKTVASAAFKGKVTLVNFFASYCGPCKKELPYLVKYNTTYKDKGFQIVGIGADSTAQRSLDFAKDHGVNFTVIADPTSKLMGTFGVYSMPATFIVDRQGVIRFMETGFKPAENADVLERKIKELLGT